MVRPGGRKQNTRCHKISVAGESVTGPVDHLSSLDWYWPPEVTAAFQQGIQAGVAKLKTANQVAQDIQTTWQKVRSSGYKFPA